MCTSYVYYYYIKTYKLITRGALNMGHLNIPMSRVYLQVSVDSMFNVWASRLRHTFM